MLRSLSKVHSGSLKLTPGLRPGTDKLEQPKKVAAPPASPPRAVIKPELLLTNSPPPLPEKSHGNDNMFCFRRAKKRRRLDSQQPSTLKHSPVAITTTLPPYNSRCYNNHSTRIRWREELEDVQFFECEERGGNKNFADSILREHEKERMNVMRCKLGEDMMVEMLSWKHPLRIQGVEPGVESGSGSTEREIQRNREKNVLAVLVFDQGKPDESPKEPDPQCLHLFIFRPMLAATPFF
eukprot:sb/3469151/